MKRIKEVISQDFRGKRSIIVALKKRTKKETEETAREILLLAKTLKLKVLHTFFVRNNTVHPGTYIGSGKIEELKRFISEHKISISIFEPELSPVQQRNLEQLLGSYVIDRTALILHIFAQHAKTHEGKIQVELAQLNYLLPRLTGHGTSLSRLGGGLGTRGPGEMKLEVYRRRIKERIHILNQKIKEIEKHRNLLRNARKKRNIPVVSLLGYTNVGKSTLLNRLSEKKNLYVADKFFSTLDPATRLVHLGDNSFCLITDTVGLIYNLPRQLIGAFKATLEEIVFSDALIILYDASTISIERQKEASLQVIKLLGIEGKPCIEVFNKIDLLSPEEINVLKGEFPEGIFISALTGEGLEKLKEKLKEILYGVKVV